MPLPTARDIDAVRDVVRRAMDDGRVHGLNAAIGAATYLGYYDFVPVLTVLRDWPRAGASPRPLTEERRAMATGTIKRLVKDKGFGFIRDEQGVEYFFHRSALPRDVRFDTLTEGERVSFEPGEGQKGPRAELVERA